MSQPIQLDLSKASTGPIAFNLNKVQEYIIELYWKSPHDLDVHALVLTNDSYQNHDDIISTYNPNLVLQADPSKIRGASGDKRPFQNAAGSVLHMGDARTGLNPNDALPDEQMKIIHGRLGAEQTQIPFFVSIHPPATAKFREVNELRLVIKQCDGVKLLEANLGRDFDNYDMVQVGMLVKSKAGEWEFDPKSTGLDGNFNTILQVFA